MPERDGQLLTELLPQQKQNRWKRCIRAQVGARDRIESERMIFCVAKQFGLSQWKVFSIPPIWDSV